MIAGLRLGILIEIVKSYKTVLSQLHDTAVPTSIFHGQVKQAALRGAIFYLGEVLHHAYVTYQSCVKYAWKELHGIYYYSVVNGLNSEKEISSKQEISERLSIENLYKKILLLAIAGPCSMRDGETAIVNADLDKLVHYVDLQPISDEIAAESYYIVNICEDAMPCAPYLQKEGEVDLGWYLITDRLGEKLKRNVVAAEEAQKELRPSDALALRLMKKLRDAWLNQIRSREIRNPSLDVVDLVCGFNAIYHVRGGEDICDDNSWGRRLNIQLSGYGRQTVCSPILENNEILIEVEPGTLEAYQVDSRAGFHRQKKNQIVIEGKECVAINRSESGCCLNWQDSGEGGTHVGELVGINHKDSTGYATESCFGVIRWLHADQPGSLDIGVELFSGQLEPVILHHTREGIKWAETIKCFLQYNHSGEAISLIAPPFYVAKDDQVRVESGGENVPVEITNIIESTDSFIRFKFEPVTAAIL